MRTLTIAGVAALLMTLVTYDKAFAFYNFRICPVPEIDASSGVGVIALLVSLLAVLYSRRTKLHRG
jgi:hypothetical protein